MAAAAAGAVGAGIPHRVQVGMQSNGGSQHHRSGIVDATQVCRLLREKQKSLDTKCSLTAFGGVLTNLAIFYGALKVAAFVVNPLLAVGTVVGIFIVGSIVTELITRKITGSIIQFRAPRDGANWTPAQKELYFNYYRYLPERAAQKFEDPDSFQAFNRRYGGQIDWSQLSADDILNWYTAFDLSPAPASAEPIS